MAIDSTLYVRRAIIAALKTAAAGDDPLPVAAIYPQEAPPDTTGRRIIYGRPVTSSFGASCLDGSRVSLVLHAFGETTGEGANTVDGETVASNLAAWAAATLDGRAFDLEDVASPVPAVATVEWARSQVFRDGSEFHAIADFTVTVAS